MDSYLHFGQAGKGQNDKGPYTKVSATHRVHQQILVATWSKMCSLRMPVIVGQNPYA